MGAEHDQVLTALALQVADLGRFPQRERFRASQGTRAPAFDELVLWRELYVWDGRNLIVWNLKALARIGSDVEFARQEVQRARIVFDELGRMYQESLGRQHTVAELASRVGFTHDDQVRRALMLLQPEGVFGDFAIWLGTVEERFRISETIVTLSAGIFPRLESKAERESGAGVDDSLSQRATTLFLEAFAEPFRERGNVQPRRPKTGKAAVVFEFLKTRGLLEKDGPKYRLSDSGKEMALRSTRLASVLELDDSGEASTEVREAVNLAGSHHKAGWERAMHLVIDFQDDLGGLADALFRILRQCRAYSRSSGIERLLGSEIQVVETALKADLPDRAVARAIAICEGLDGIDPVIGLLQQHLPTPR
jgi:hypothetical protein